MNATAKFRVELVGSFYTLELYDERGREVFDLDAATEAAEELYGSKWSCVYNGEKAMNREEWLNQSSE